MTFIENLEEIESKLDIESVLKECGHDIGPIQRSGGEIRCRCPIHIGTR